jgi:hypothetical protein
MHGFRRSVHYSILSLFSDEAHVYCRSWTSQRSRTYRHLLSLAKFSVYISGTPFPYGTHTDAAVVLEHIGGPFQVNETGGKWTLQQRHAFSNLLSKNDRWDILIFRVLISEFCLRRTTESKWENQWIIPRSVVRPTPLVRAPTSEDLWDDNTRREIMRLGRGLTKRMHLSERMERADRLRCLMWAPGAYDEVVKRTGGKLSDSQKLIEEAMSSTLFCQSPTSRVYELVGLIRGCTVRKKRLIIVADRLYLITLAVLVSPPMSFANQKLCTEMGLQVGVLAGSQIYESKITSREDAVRQLNAGSIDVLVMTPGVGGTGLNMTGACVMVYMGSLYSISSERQCIGMSLGG